MPRGLSIITSFWDRFLVDFGSQLRPLNLSKSWFFQKEKPGFLKNRFLKKITKWGAFQHLQNSQPFYRLSRCWQLVPTMAGSLAFSIFACMRETEVMRERAGPPSNRFVAGMRQNEKFETNKLL